jgi:hypothetical protein
MAEEIVSRSGMKETRKSGRKNWKGMLWSGKAERRREVDGRL